MSLRDARMPSLREKLEAKEVAKTVEEEVEETPKRKGRKLKVTKDNEDEE